MTSPFAPITVDGLELRNRFVRSATWDHAAREDGEVTDASVALFEGLARGGVGLIVTGYAYVSEQGKAAPCQYGAAEGRHIAGLRRLVRVAHDHGARIALQIAHAGLQLHLLQSPDRVGLAPSRVESYPLPHRAFTAAEIEGTVADFAAAAVRAREAGFDAVQLHAAHGYLMSQFLSPLTNRRTDEWGGSPEGRRRFHVEVLRAVRRAVGEDYPVLMKLGLRDHGEGGLTLGEGLEALRALAAGGLSAVEVSAGQAVRAARVKKPEDEEEAYFRAESAEAKRAVDIPVMLVGGIRSLSMAGAILGNGEADMVSLCRPLIREPDLIARWQRGDTSPSKCLSCAKCLAALVRRGPVACQEELRLREEAAAAG